MIDLKSGFKSTSFTYDVVRDGGTQIQHLSGSFVPGRALVVMGFIQVTTTFVDSGGGASIGLGVPGFVGFVLATSPVAMFTANNIIAVPTVQFATGLQVTTDVVNDNLVAGRFVCTLWYNEFSE